MRAGEWASERKAGACATLRAVQPARRRTLTRPRTVGAGLSCSSLVGVRLPDRVEGAGKGRLPGGGRREARACEGRASVLR